MSRTGWRVGQNPREGATRVHIGRRALAPLLAIPLLVTLLPSARVPAVAQIPPAVEPVFRERVPTTPVLRTSAQPILRPGEQSAADKAAIGRHVGRVAPVRPSSLRPVTVELSGSVRGEDAAIDRQLGRVRPVYPASPQPVVVRVAAPNPRDDTAIDRQLAAEKPIPALRHRLVVDRPAVVQWASDEPVAWSFDYARATAAVPVYELPAAAAPTGVLDPTGRWVALVGQAEVDGVVWYQLARGGWAPSTVLAPAELPTFRGVVLKARTPSEIAFVMVDTLNVRARPGTSEDNVPVTTLRRYDVVELLEDRAVEGATWHRVGRDMWIHGGYARPVPWATRPEAVEPDEKWIDVNLTQQTLIAYEGDRAVFATLVSSGLPRTPTWAGLSRIWGKYLWTKMSGGDRAIPGDYYWLDHVPHTMYFHAGFGLHAAYWHNDFGRPKSHGCVNLSPSDAEWLFDWAALEVEPGERHVRATKDDPGTWVWTHW